MDRWLLDWHYAEADIKFIIGWNAVIVFAVSNSVLDRRVSQYRTYVHIHPGEINWKWNTFILSTTTRSDREQMDGHLRVRKQKRMRSMETRIHKWPHKLWTIWNEKRETINANSIPLFFYLWIIKCMYTNETDRVSNKFSNFLIIIIVHIL